MAKKTSSRSRRDSKSRINEAQIQAYRARKAETVANPHAQLEKPDAAHEVVAPSRMVSSWGHLGDEYSMIRSDLIRLLIITAAMFAIILVLWFFLA